MEGEKDGSILWQSGGCGRSHTRDSASAGREQSSGKAQRPAGYGSCSRGRCGIGEDPGAVPQEKEEGMARDSAASRPLSVFLNGRAVETFEGGGKREPIATRHDLIPPVALMQIAEAMAQGAAKYGEQNWRGLPVSNCINHALRHINQFLIGDRTENHLSHAAANLLMAIDIQESK